MALIFRNVVSDIKENPIKPSCADTKMFKELNEKFGNATSSVVLHLPSKETRKRAFRYARQTTQPEDIEATNIPELLTVSSTWKVLTIFILDFKGCFRESEKLHRALLPQDWTSICLLVWSGQLELNF